MTADEAVKSIMADVEELVSGFPDLGQRWFNERHAKVEAKVRALVDLYEAASGPQYGPLSPKMVAALARLDALEP